MGMPACVIKSMTSLPEIPGLSSEWLDQDVVWEEHRGTVACRLSGTSMMLSGVSV